MTSSPLSSGPAGARRFSCPPAPVSSSEHLTVSPHVRTDIGSRRADPGAVSRGRSATASSLGARTVRPRCGALAAVACLLLAGLALPGSAAAIDCPIPGPGWKFLGDLNYPDGTVVSQGAVINKGWRLQNCGTTDWSGFRAVRISGIYGPSEMALPDARSLEAFDLYQVMTVPLTSGTHRAEYKVVTDTGVPLAESFWVEVEVVGGGPSFTLSVSKSGSGNVTSTPGGISCGGACSASFASGTTVSLDADAAPGWVFAGWSGDGDCGDGVVVMTGNRSCQATFEPASPTSPVLTVSTSGSGSGTVTGPGINCGADCSQSFSPGTIVNLVATPSGSSTFGGWSGDCTSSGQVTMDGNRHCTATFTGVSACTPGLVVNVSPAGMALADGWPSPNPVTVTMVASSGGTCSGDAQLRIGLGGDTPRFYVYEAGPTAGCEAAVDVPGGFSTTSYLLNCPLTLGSGGSQTYSVKLWMQPSAGGTLDISSSWKGLSRTETVFVPAAEVHPVVFVHGIQGSQPPQNKVITDRETGRRVLDPFLGNYQPLLDQLVKMGYEWDKTLFAVAYDWRKSNDESAAFLRSSLSGTVIPRSSGVPYVAGDGRADILVHSMGGLVTRAYVQGSYDHNLRKAIFVATPHKGFPFDYRTWEGMTWSDYVASAPLSTGFIFQFVLDKVIWPSQVAKRYRPSLAELELSCTFREAVDDFLPSPYSGNVYVFTKDPVRGFWVCSPQEIYRWAHSTDPSRAIGSLPQMLPTEDRKDYLFDPIFGIARPFGYEPNPWLTNLNAGIGSLGSELGVGNIYTIVGNKGDTDQKYRVEPPGYVIGSQLWRYGTVNPFWPFVQEEPNGDTLIPLWSTGLKASGLLSLPDGNEVVLDASKSCSFPPALVCDSAHHSPIMYQDATQMKHVPRMLAGVELPFKTEYFPPILDIDLGDPVPRLVEIATLMTACPIDLYVVDPLGRRLGKDPVTGQIHAEVPGAIYTDPGVEPQAVLIPNPAPGRYEITAVGYGEGLYSFRVDRTGGETVTLGVFGGETAPGEASPPVTIELLPNEPPTADAGPDQFLTADEGCTAAAVLDGTASFDPDGDSLAYTWTGPMGILEGESPTAVLPPGTHTVTLTVHDGNGRTASDTVDITVEDVTPPTLGVPPPLTAEQTSLAGTPVVLPVTATDNCGVATVTSDAPAVFPLGTTTVTFTAVDAYGNASAASTAVTVVDTTPPAIANVPPAVTVEQATAAGTLVTLDMPTATDVCDAAPVLVTSHSTPAVFPLGATIVTFTATDASGNVSTATTTVTVVDTTPPVLTKVPKPKTVEQTSHRGTPVDLPLPTATDICDASPRVKSDAPDVFPLGKTKVTFTATDDSGNRTRATTTVTVEDTTPPDIKSVHARPSELWPPNHKMKDVRVEVSVKDICDTRPSCKIVSVTSNESVTGKDDHTSPDWQITGNLTVELRAERSGKGKGRLYWIKVRCTDDSGNRSTRTATVEVPHDNGGHDEDDDDRHDHDKQDRDKDEKDDRGKGGGKASDRNGRKGD